MDIILFGCGVSGYEALCFLGEENVKCFCDITRMWYKAKSLANPYCLSWR